VRLSLSLFSLSVCLSPPRSFSPRAGTLASCCNFARISLVCNFSWTLDSCKCVSFQSGFRFSLSFSSFFLSFFSLSLSLSLSSLFLSSLSLSLSLPEMQCEKWASGASKGHMRFCELAKIPFRAGLGSVQTSVLCESAMATWYTHLFLKPQIWPT